MESKEKLDAIAMHIADTYMPSVVARDPLISAEQYASEYLRVYEQIKRVLYDKYGVVQSNFDSDFNLNSFIK